MEVPPVTEPPTVVVLISIVLSEIEEHPPATLVVKRNVTVPL